MLNSFDQLQILQNHIRAQKEDYATYAAPDYSKLRFRLGTSLAETKIPYVLDKELQTLIKEAADQLVVAIPLRHRSEFGPLELDAVLLDPSSERVTLPQASWYLGDVPPDSIFQRIITRSLKRNRRLDPAMLVWFIGRNGIGRRLLDELNKLLAKAKAEADDRGDGEDTTRLALMAVVREWHVYHSSLEERFHHSMLTEAYNAAGVVFHEMISALLLEQFPALASKPPSSPEADVLYGALLPVSPLIFATGKVAYEKDPISPFGLSVDSIEAMEAFFPKMLSRATPLSEVEKQLRQRVAADKQAPAFLLSDVRTQQLHEALVDLKIQLKPESAGAADINLFLREECSDYQELLQRVLDRKKRKEWQEKAKQVSAGDYKAPFHSFVEAVGATANLSEGFFSDKQALQKAFQQQVHRFIILRHAEALNDALVSQLKLFQPFAGDGHKAKEAHENGQLYRFSTDDQIILKGGSTPKEAQLFIDLKDFTKRTFASKELAMADFMKSEFYEPILEAAKSYMVDMAHLDKSDLAVNNLMGDAVLASGGAKSLVSFAHDILQLAAGYAEKLRDRMPAGFIENKVAELTASYEEKKTALEEEWKKNVEPSRKLAAQIKGMDAKDPKRAGLMVQQRNYQESANAAVRQLKDAKAEFEEAKAHIEGSGLEAGAYIAFGNAAEIIQFKDHAFGNLRVAIGEKINESARGTAREVGVRARLRHLVDQARGRERNPEIEYPFRVFVDNTIYPVLEPDLTAQLQTALDAKDAAGIKKIVNSFSQRLLNDLTTRGGENVDDYRMLARGNGIYNLGLAISREALDAYLNEVPQSRQLEWKVGDFHPEIRRRFVFPKDQYQLIIVEKDDGQPEIYVEHGSMVFKGFEKAEPVMIWERLLPKTLFYSLAVKHHLATWLQGGGAKV